MCIRDRVSTQSTWGSYTTSIKSFASNGKAYRKLQEHCEKAKNYKDFGDVTVKLQKTDQDDEEINKQEEFTEEKADFIKRFFHELKTSPMEPLLNAQGRSVCPVSYTHLRAHETDSYLVCRLLLEKKKQTAFALHKSP
eukprot:TRINITY_DN3226_c0_g1_i6.p1 TRINITY_DN3226_c0_g1~~TRINITY_DN3226_c0_g1_i6.p1  ORF type:complete len:138 (+),score=38.50 TRINITY_DN3226_c0_g1_i6:67-480(+)